MSGKTHSQFIEDAARFIPRADSYLSRIADSAEEIALSLKEIEHRLCPPDANRPDPFSVPLKAWRGGVSIEERRAAALEIANSRLLGRDELRRYRANQQLSARLRHLAGEIIKAISQIGKDDIRPAPVGDDRRDNLSQDRGAEKNQVLPRNHDFTKFQGPLLLYLDTDGRLHLLSAPVESSPPASPTAPATDRLAGSLPPEPASHHPDNDEYIPERPFA